MAIDTTKKAPPKRFKGFVKRHPIVVFFGVLLLAALLYAGVGSLVDWRKLRSLSESMSDMANRIAVSTDSEITRSTGCGRGQGKVPGPLGCSESMIITFYTDNESDAVSRFRMIRSEIEKKDFERQNLHELTSEAYFGNNYGYGGYRHEGSHRCSVGYSYGGTLGNKGEVRFSCDSTPWILERVQFL